VAALGRLRRAPSAAAAVVAIVVLGALALPTLDIYLGQQDNGAMPESTDARRASDGLTGDPTVKQFGVGMGVALAVDATLVRCLLVPAVMVLVGRANW
jgi:uncharacterized membrane protein YdfJ with MMPL/SSD domain